VRRAQVWIPLLLVVATAAVYEDVRRHDFVDLDDFPYVLENRDLRVSSPAAAVAVAFRSTSQVNWTPLTVLSLQADRALYGDEAPGYLLGNVALHAASAVLLFLALLRLSGDAGPSAFVAGVFALHPLHVESVAWAAQRKDVLSGLFWMLTLLAYAAYAARPAARRYLWVLLALCAALLAKPVAVTLPCVLLLLDFWPLGRLAEPAARRRALLEKLPLLLPALLVAALTLMLQQGVDAVTDTQRLPIATRLAVATDAYAVYLLKSVWPSGLAVFYSYPAAGIPLPRLAAELLLLGGASAAALLLARSRPYLLVGWLWYLGVLVPTIGLVQVGSQARADSCTYLPMIGLAIAVAWGARDLAGASSRRRVLLAGAGGLACLALAATAALQVRHWRDAIALHRHAISVTRDNVSELLRLSRALRLAGRSEEAVPPLERALELAPRDGHQHAILGDLYARLGRLEEAEAAYRRGLRLEPDNPLGQANLGLTLVRLDRPREAKWHLKRALQLHAERTGSLPDLATPYLALAEAHVELGELDRALPYYTYAASLEPRRSARVGALLALALAEAGRFEEARALLDEAGAGAPGAAELRNAAHRIDALSHAPLR
jgi:Flp pilus assembly protein TadD